jgi:hypothetical protein
MQSGQDGNSGDPTEPLDRPWRFYLKPDAYALHAKNSPRVGLLASAAIAGGACGFIAHRIRREPAR